MASTLIVTALSLLLAYVLFYIPLYEKWNKALAGISRSFELHPGVRTTIWIPSSDGAVCKGSVIYNKDGELRFNLKSDMGFAVEVSTDGAEPYVEGFAGFHKIVEDYKLKLEKGKKHCVRLYNIHTCTERRVEVLQLLIYDKA